MFQSFDDKADGSHGKARASALRAMFDPLGIDGFIVPRSDEHQGEYVPPSAERLAWLTGFTGSAGTAVVLAGKAAIFVDGRYTVQVRDQVDLSVFEPVFVIETPVSAWLRANAPDGARIGYDPWLMTRAQVRQIARALEAIGGEMVRIDANPIDALWQDRPAPPLAPALEHPDGLAGRPVAEKLAEIRDAIREARADAAILTDPASVAWAFNMRGGDVPHTPLPLSFAILHADHRPALFIDGRKLSNALRDRLEDVADVLEPGVFRDALEALGRARRRVLYDPNGSSEAVAFFIEETGGAIVEGADPVALPKARKSPAEITGTRRAHLRDGAAMVRFLAWLEGVASDGTVTEIAAAERLETIRAEMAEADGVPLADIAFDTISSTGPNGAINHYRVTRRTDRALAPGDLYLVDSGAQYRDGTTDVTRTVLVGTASPQRLDLYRDRFTRVLKGMIAIASARFPKGTSGAQLDALARQALWQAGLDFDHGTGHGVGAYLSVHEGPQRLAKTGHTPLEPGMILSDEPGYYLPGDFGIRIENLIVVREAEPIPGGERPMLGFDTITLAPIDRRLIAPRLMNAAEIAWLDTYHMRVWGALSGWPGLTAE